MYPFLNFWVLNRFWARFLKKKVERNLQCQLCAKRMKVKFGGEKRMEVKLPPYKNTIFFGHQHLKKKRSKNRFFFEKILHPFNASVKQSKVTQETSKQPS